MHGGKSHFHWMCNKDVLGVSNYHLQYILLPDLSDVYENENGKK